MVRRALVPPLVIGSVVAASAGVVVASLFLVRGCLGAVIAPPEPRPPLPREPAPPAAPK